MTTAGRFVPSTLFDVVAPLTLPPPVSDWYATTPATATTTTSSGSTPAATGSFTNPIMAYENRQVCRRAVPHPHPRTPGSTLVLSRDKRHLARHYSPIPHSSSPRRYRVLSLARALAAQGHFCRFPARPGRPQVTRTSHRTFRNIRNG